MTDIQPISHERDVHMELFEGSRTKEELLELISNDFRGGYSPPNAIAYAEAHRLSSKLPNSGRFKALTTQLLEDAFSHHILRGVTHREGPTLQVSSSFFSMQTRLRKVLAALSEVVPEEVAADTVEQVIEVFRTKLQEREILY